MNARHKFASHQLTADYSLELEAVLTGDYTPGEPMTRDDPGCEAGVEDIDIASLFALKHVRRNGTSTWERVDLLAGIDPRSDTYRRLIANLLGLIGQDTAAETLLGEVMS